MSENQAAYRLEYALSGRSKCKGRKPCNGTEIPKGHLRFGSLVTIPDDKTFFAWRHWGCVTAKVISNVKQIYDAPSDIAGFEALREEDKTRVINAWAVDQVAHEDVPDTAR
ncbi:hypothetical protein B0H16DRAFT_1445244, partial [Mycena metata]